MSSLRLVLRDFSVKRIWSAWTRAFIFNTVVKRCKSDRAIKEVFQCFKHTLLRPRRTLLLSATAAYKAHNDETETPQPCDQNISDEELEALVTELEGVEELSRTTLFCTSCGKRLVIDKKHPGVPYCACNEGVQPQNSHDGWVPYMEAEDVIIWRKENKPGQGMYAYKVYGRYKDVRAEDFAAVQVDGSYRRVWDKAVAALSVVEERVGGIADQAVLHWEVLWPRLFANRDYVYIRRHKEFEVRSSPPLPHVGELFDSPPVTLPPIEERPSVHSRAKRKGMEMEMRERRRAKFVDQQDKVFIIVSRSCEHPSAPETKHAIRVNEYWSHMVVKSTSGAKEVGMEFVLTYYDEPAVGGMPSGVAAWATGRAAPAYLEKMRRAAGDYKCWQETQGNSEVPSFHQAKENAQELVHTVSEQEIEASNKSEDKLTATRDQSTQTEEEEAKSVSTTSQTEEQEEQGVDTVTLNKIPTFQGQGDQIATSNMADTSHYAELQAESLKPEDDADKQDDPEPNTEKSTTVTEKEALS